MAKVLSINAGSSSLKWKLFEMPSERQLAEGATDNPETINRQDQVWY
jgi:acetate kinase